METKGGEETYPAFLKTLESKCLVHLRIPNGPAGFGERGCILIVNGTSRACGQRPAIGVRKRKRFDSVFGMGNGLGG